MNDGDIRSEYLSLSSHKHVRFQERQEKMDVFKRVTSGQRGDFPSAHLDL